jgi:peptide/nickel transport system ATP-binding protein
MTPILSVEHLSLHYRTRAGNVSAVDDVSFSLAEGESLGLVGESGCGKTTIASALLKLLAENAVITDGRIVLKGVDLVPLSETEVNPYRWRNVAMVFQAAMNSLNPVYTVGDQIVEAIQTHAERPRSEAKGKPAFEYDTARERVAQLFGMVGLDAKLMDRYPHEFSGGMRQRAVIAMALACHPDLVVADEPTTALDVIVQDSLLRELKQLQQRIGMSMIYISHDIAVIAEVSDRIGVMYAGRLVELGSSDAVFHRPLHPYTAALMSAFPSVTGPKRPLQTLAGEPPNLLNPPTGCRFHPRCAFATDVCREQRPTFEDMGDGHFVACFHPVAT